MIQQWSGGGKPALGTCLSERVLGDRMAVLLVSMARVSRKQSFKGRLPLCRPTKYPEIQNLGVLSFGCYSESVVVV